MIALADWAKRHGLSPEAMSELRVMLAVEAPEPTKCPEGAKENWVQNQLRMQAPAAGYQLWRNNSGALKDERGVPVRYGLGNDSASMNKVMKSADLIGGYSLLITSEHVGQTVLQFTSIECKRPDWTPRENDPHEQAQRRWMNLILSRGGRACFSTGGFPE